MRIARSLAVALFCGLSLFPSLTSAQVTPLASPGPCPAPACTVPISSSQLQNLGQLKDEVRTYYANGSYTAEVASIDDAAARYIDERVSAGAKQPAIVLDIDDTALLTVGYELDHDFGYDPASWNAYASRDFPAIAATLALTRHAQSEGVVVFFITGRRTPQADITAKNLADAGYSFAHLYLRPSTDHAPSVAPYKSATRAAIEVAGYTILETIGDQWSDLEGGHAERAFKLPNPMYVYPMMSLGSANSFNAVLSMLDRGSWSATTLCRFVRETHRRGL